MNPPDLQPVVAGVLCLVLAALHAAGSVAVLRVLSVCRHHVDRLAELDELENRMIEQETKAEARRKESAR